MRRTNRLLVALGAFAAVVLSTTVTAAPAWSHGYASSPPSRSANCANGTVSNCGAIQWEPQSVEGLKGFPGAGPADGQICAGGISHFSQLDDPRGGSWPATTVTAGQRTFTWTLTAAHATDKWEYYITKDGWNPNQPLRRADLDLVPIYAKHDGAAVLSLADLLVGSGSLAGLPRGRHVPRRRGHVYLEALFELRQSVADGGVRGPGEEDDDQAQGEEQSPKPPPVRRHCDSIDHARRDAGTMTTRRMGGGEADRADGWPAYPGRKMGRESGCRGSSDIVVCVCGKQWGGSRYVRDTRNAWRNRWSIRSL
jgi:hypothetical protein